MVATVACCAPNSPELLQPKHQVVMVPTEEPIVCNPLGKISQANLDHAFPCYSNACSSPTFTDTAVTRSGDATPNINYITRDGPMGGGDEVERLHSADLSIKATNACCMGNSQLKKPRSQGDKQRMSVGVESKSSGRKVISRRQNVDQIVKRQSKKRKPPSTYVCSRCRHHEIVAIKKSHTCPFSTCKCTKCNLFEEKRRIENELALMKQREKESTKDPAEAMSHASPTISDDSPDIEFIYESQSQEAKINKVNKAMMKRGEKLKESLGDPTEARSDDSPDIVIIEESHDSPDIILIPESPKSPEPLSPEAKVLLQLINALAINPISFTPPEDFDYNALDAMFNSPTVVLPAWMMPELTNIYELANEAMCRYPNLRIVKR